MKPPVIGLRIVTANVPKGLTVNTPPDPVNNIELKPSYYYPDSYD